MPTVVFLVGQPGAGKSRVTELVATQLNRHGGSVGVDSDLYKPHPAYIRDHGLHARGCRPRLAGCRASLAAVGAAGAAP